MRATRNAHARYQSDRTGSPEGAASGLGSDPPAAPEQALDELGLGLAQIDAARETLVACLAEEGGQR